MAPATTTTPAPPHLAPPVVQPGIPVVQPGVRFTLARGHCCDTFHRVPGVQRQMYTCNHNFVLHHDDVRDAFLRAGETR